MIAHSQSPAVRRPQTYDGFSHGTEAIARQTTFAALSPRPNNNATAPQLHFSPVRTTRLPSHFESSMNPSPPIQGSGIPVDVVTQIPHQHQLQDVPQLRNPSSQRVLTAPPPSPEISVRLQTDGTGKVSDSYSKWVLGPGITSSDFFAWFASQTASPRTLT